MERKREVIQQDGRTKQLHYLTILLWTSSGVEYYRIKLSICMKKYNRRGKEREDKSVSLMNNQTNYGRICNNIDESHGNC